MLILTAPRARTIVAMTLIVIWPLGASAQDPLCNTPAATLKTLKNCTRLYCSKKTNSATATSLKGMDETLFNHRAISDRLAETFAKFVEACQKVRRCGGNCPALEETQKLYPRIGIMYDQIEEREADIKAFNTARQNLHMTENDAACSNDIKQQIEDAARRRERRVAEIDKELEKLKCAPGY